MTPLTLGSMLAAVALGLAPQLSPVTPGDPLISAEPSTGQWPIAGASVETEFDDPLPYAPGHRGVDLQAPPGTTVASALPGRVTVAGLVAGRSLVVVEHGSGLRTTYLPVAPSVDVGERVAAGDRIGSVTGPSHCLSTTCLHWGARRGEQYIDPRSLVPPTGPIVLLPLD